MQQLEISPQSGFDVSQVERLIQQFQTEGDIIKNNRNVIKSLTFEGKEVVVKSFSGMYFFNRLGYTINRQSKAKRSYRYALKLQAMGFNTPTPVAYIDDYEAFLLKGGYFISEKVPYQTLGESLEARKDKPKERKQVVESFADLAVRLHRAGVYHKDFSVGNFLTVPQGHGFDFSIVDLNRMQFGEIPTKKRIKNFHTLGLEPEDLNLFLETYAQLSGRSNEEVLDYFWKYKQVQARRKGLKRNFKKRFLGR